MDMPKCTKTYGPNSMRNAIQHARHHIITGNATINKDKWQEWTQGEKITRGCRLRTLQKYNPWGEKEQKEQKTTTKEEIGKNLQKTSKIWTNPYKKQKQHPEL